MVVLLTLPFSAFTTIDDQTIELRILEVDWFRIGTTIIHWPSIGNGGEPLPNVQRAARAVKNELS